MSSNPQHKIVRNLLILFLWTLFLTNLAHAATYYVRPDGGTTSQCTGLADNPYPGSGKNQSCAWNHPFWAIAPIGNNPTKLQGGDTLIIGLGEYKIGYGAPNTGDTSKCYPNWPWDCVMRSIPSGPDPARPTRILGKGWDADCSNPPQLFGVERIWQVLSLQASNNVELQCLDITDHSDCQVFGPKPCKRDGAPPYGEWAVTGISASDSSNVLIKNVAIHGLYRGIHAGRIKDWTIEDSQIVNNSFVGWDGDIGANQSSNSGTMTFNRTKILYSGCGETYPLPGQAGLAQGKQPYNCYSQDQGGYGDGLGTHSTGGYWVFHNVDFSHNVSDGLDLLYHNGNGTITIKRSRFEGNAGNQVKVSADTVIENSLIVGNCGYFKNQPFTWKSATFNHCRAAGSSIAAAFRAGTKVNLLNSTITGNGDVIVLSSGSECTGKETFTSRNNIFLGGIEFNDGKDLSALYYASGRTGNADGPCGSLPMNDDYSIIWNTKNFASDCKDKSHSKCTDPKLIGPIISFYSGAEYNLDLLAGSPAINAALVIPGLSNLDYNEFDRGASWDIGALEFGSSRFPQPDSSTAGTTKGEPKQANPISLPSAQNPPQTNSPTSSSSSTSDPKIVLVNFQESGKKEEIKIELPKTPLPSPASQPSQTSQPSQSSQTEPKKEEVKIDPPKPPEPLVSLPKEEVKVEPKKEEPKVEAKKEDIDPPKPPEPLVNLPKEETKIEPKKEEIKIEPKQEEIKVEPKKEEVKIESPKEETKMEPKKEEAPVLQPVIQPPQEDASPKVEISSYPQPKITDTVPPQEQTDKKEEPIVKPPANESSPNVKSNITSIPLSPTPLPEVTVEKGKGGSSVVAGGSGGGGSRSNTGSYSSRFKIPGPKIQDTFRPKTTTQTSSVDSYGKESSIKKSNQTKTTQTPKPVGLTQNSKGRSANEQIPSQFLLVKKAIESRKNLIEAIESKSKQTLQDDSPASSISLEETLQSLDALIPVEEKQEEQEKQEEEEKETFCGDGSVNQKTEQCDDGNSRNGDGCDASCQIELCGNGILQPGELCDDGNRKDRDGCDRHCITEICGNGIFQASTEACDDGNILDDDGCSHHCQKEQST